MALNYEKVRGQSSDGEYLLLSTSKWFYAKDGQQYKAAWGKCRVIAAVDVLGFQPKNSANWLIQVGEGEDALFLMGCQVNYVQLCQKPPLGTSVYKVE